MRLKSLLSWERGLKLLLLLVQIIAMLVAPLVGAWIEMDEELAPLDPNGVAPLVGAWIEIKLLSGIVVRIGSLLSWERGLKFHLVLKNGTSDSVAPLVGAWIEIVKVHRTMRVQYKRRSSRGSVD